MTFRRLASSRNTFLSFILSGTPLCLVLSAMYLLKLKAIVGIPITVYIITRMTQSINIAQRATLVSYQQPKLGNRRGVPHLQRDAALPCTGFDIAGRKTGRG